MHSLTALSVPRFAAAICAVISGMTPAFALAPEFYASSSKLASGKWAKIEVKESGIQFISNSTLKSLGFTDPDKVNVYGYGGRALPEKLDSSMTDDLPMVPSLKTPAGIVFFGHGIFSWANESGSKLAYRHTINPYSNQAYYFISDSGDKRMAPGEAETGTPSANMITSFTERIIHEKDQISLFEVGRNLFGEDFRTQRLQTFQFNLPGNTGNTTMQVRFGTNFSAGNASLTFTANGEQLPNSVTDNPTDNGNSSFLFKLTTINKEIPNPGEKLNLAIELQLSGAIFGAALDYIHLEYPRELKMSGNELYFYINPEMSSTVAVGNCDDSTVIWDVTDPLLPLDVKYTLSGSTASFNVPAGSREFVAFKPGAVTRQVVAAGKIQNQDIHAMDAPDMLIISPDEFKEAAHRLADFHAAYDGADVAVLSPQQIYNEFSSGVPDITAFRKLLKMWYDRAGATPESDYTKYCLLMGRPSYDNKMVVPVVRNSGYPRVPIWHSNANQKSNAFSTDDYIGMIDDNKGNFSISSAKIRVAVGRMPVKSISEANMAVTKLENYINNPTLGAWRNNVMLIADDQDYAKHLIQAENACEAMRNNGNGANFLYEKLYLDAYELTYGGTGPIYPKAKERMFDKFAEGVGYINYIGHANPKSWGHESLLTWSDINSMDNKNLPFLYAATCEFLRWDSDEVSGAEVLWLKPSAGFIGMICPSREVYIDQNGDLNRFTSKYVYRRDSDNKPMTVGQIMISGKNEYTGANDNKLRYGLMGDPMMRILSPSLCVSVDSIGDTELESAADLPVIPARASFVLSGSIRDFDGNLIPDFNGIVEIQLFDAERVITTKGNGKDGLVTNYNDHKNRLYTGKVKVADGRWSTIVKMPSEIENNYSPALISLYAYDSEGREANGASNKLYVYGYDENAPEDSEGPEISDFYLNSSAFRDGDYVSPYPIAFARFHDESGINISDSGIGHKMSLSIDGDNFFSDVNLYYSPDENDCLAGTIAYPLDGIAPGEHTLKLTVWDNANNSTTRTLSFNVAASWTPEITRLATDANPATTNVNFIVSTDGASGNMECAIEVFDLSGRRVWTGNAMSMSSADTTVRIGWDLHSTSGSRVPRGIYIYRAIVTTAEGAVITKTNKLAVAAE